MTFVLGPAELNTLIESLTSGSWQTNINALLSKSPLGLTSHGYTYLSSSIFDQICNDKRLKAFELLILALALSSGHALASSRFFDCLRPSKYSPSNLKTLASVLRMSSDWSETHHLPYCARLNTFHTFVSLAQKVAIDEGHIVSELKRSPYLVIMSLATVEEKFHCRINPSHESLFIPKSVNSLSAEELASAVSFIVALYVRAGLLLDLRSMALPPHWQHHLAKCGDIIMLSYHVNCVRESEIRIFHLSYLLTHKKGVWQLSAPTDEFGMALSHGYTKNELQFAARLNGIHRKHKGALCFADFCNEAFDKIPDLFGMSIFQIGQDPPKGLQIHLRSDVATAIVNYLEPAKCFFYEDAIYLADLGFELLASKDRLLNTKITPHINIRDLVSMHRIMCFWSLARFKALKQPPFAADSNIYYVSLMGLLPNIVDFLVKHGIDENKARDFATLLTYDPSKDNVIDIQYTPNLKLQDKYMTLPAVTYCSNYIRNVLARSKKRIYKDSTEDPVVDILQRALKTRTKSVKANLTYKGGELDVVAMVEDSLFIFECKNTLLPCSPFEQRTLIDHVNKSCVQLDRIVGKWHSQTFRADIARRLRWPIEDCEIHTCIVLNVRLLSGIHYGGHPVRPIRELENFILNGQLDVVNGNETYSADTYRGRGFSASALNEYLSEQCPIYSIWKNATTKKYRGHKGGSWKLFEAEYGVNYNKVVLDTIDTFPNALDDD